MKLVVKTVQGNVLNVDVSESDSISAVKGTIEACDASLPAASLVLIHSGKILSNETTLAAAGVVDGGFVVAMVSAKRATAAAATKAETQKTETTAKAAATTPAPTPTPTPAATSKDAEGTDAAATTTAEETATPAATVNPTETDATTAVATPAAPEKAQPVPSSAAQEAVQEPVAMATEEPANAEINAASNLVSGSAVEETINSMMEMGFPREDCQRALRAAFNNPERAVEYLMTGIPEAMQEPQQPPPQPAMPIPAAGAAAQAPIPTPAAPTTTPPAPAAAAGPGGPNVRPLDMFNPSADAGGGGEGELQFLRDHPQFQTLRAMMASNPALLQPMLQELGKQNPQLLQLINANQQEFYSLLNDMPTDGMEEDSMAAAMGGAGGGMGQQNVTLELTPEDNEAIERLTSLGFDRNVAAQAFFACEKNEQLAANYLFDHGHELMEQ